MGTRVLPEFEYLRPESIEEAVSLAKEYEGKVKFLAGGTDLLIDMKLLRVRADYLIDIRGIDALRGITFDGKKLRIGATTLIRELANHPLIKEKYAALFEATSQMATSQIRNIATIGGNLCTASPGAENAPPLLVLGAKVEIAGQSGLKTVPLEEFFVGPRETVMTTGDMLTGISVPALPHHGGTSFVKISRTHSDLRQINAAAALRSEKGVCKEVRIALGAVAPTPIRAMKAEDTLRHKRLSREAIEEAANMVIADINPRTSIRSTSDYRKRVAPVLVRRALTKAFERIQEAQGKENG